METIERDSLFTALTRPQMFAGVTYSFFVVNGIITTELFLIFHSFWVLIIALIIHAIGAIFCLKEPRIFDLWFTKVSQCPRIRNYSLWRCNSYKA